MITLALLLMGSILVLRVYYYFATRTLAVRNSLLKRRQYATIIKSFYFFHIWYNHSHLKSRSFRFEKNYCDGRWVMHYRTLLLIDAPNVIRLDDFWHLIATIFEKNDRIDNIWNRNGLDRIFGESSLYLPFNPVYQTYLIMNQSIML